MPAQFIASKIHDDEKTDWMTPVWIIELVVLLMGWIDLDPASSAQANEHIGADSIYTEQDDGLKQLWWFGKTPTKCFVNAPGRQVLVFWRKLIEEYLAGRVEQAFWVGFNADQLRYLCVEPNDPFSYYVCIPRKRIRFVPTSKKQKNRPSHANYLVWIVKDTDANWEKFKAVMGKHGRCYRRAQGS